MYRTLFLAQSASLMISSHQSCRNPASNAEHPEEYAEIWRKLNAHAERDKSIQQMSDGCSPSSDAPADYHQWTLMAIRLVNDLPPKCRPNTSFCSRGDGVSKLLVRSCPYHSLKLRNGRRAQRLLYKSVSPFPADDIWLVFILTVYIGERFTRRRMVTNGIAMSPLMGNN